MSEKFSKTVTSYSQQKTTKTTESSSTVFVKQTLTLGNGNLPRYSLASNTVTFGTSSESPRLPSYQPVYDRTRKLASRNDATTVRNSPIYRSLLNPPSSFNINAVATGRNQNNLTNNQFNQTRSATSSSLFQPTAASTCISYFQDAGAFGSTRTAQLPLVNTTKQERYVLSKPAYVLIFHHIFKNDKALFRKGSEHDLKLIRDFFGNYNAKIANICEDFSVQKVKNRMNEVRRKKFDKYSCLIVIIMSHGKANDQILAVDECYQLDKAIVEPTLMNDTLKGKPKIFIVNACKGNAQMETDYVLSATNKFDILKCFSTYEGTVSFRDDMSGTTFIQTFFKLIEKSHGKEVIEIMRLLRNTFVDNRIAQAPTETSTLTKQFYFSDLKK